MEKRIVVPLDGSPLAERALPHAVALAQLTSQSLTLLRVVPPIFTTAPAFAALPTGKVWDSYSHEAALAGEYLNEAASSLQGTGIEAQTVVLEDDPAAALVHYAEQHPEVSTIVMATHGRSGLSRWVFGSVAEKVLHASPVPMLVVRVKHGGRSCPDTNEPCYRKIVVPLDGSPFAEQALEHAATLAAAQDGKIDLVSVASDYPEYIVLSGESPTPAERQGNAERMMAYLEHTAQRLRLDGLQVETNMAYGPPADGILRVVERTCADLVVMATHGRSGLSRLWLGSVAIRVVQGSERPVLLVRAKERVEEPEAERVRPGYAIPSGMQ